MGEFFHSDICGLLPVTLQGGARYFVTFIDKTSNFVHVDFMRLKSNLYECFQKFERSLANKFGRPMKVLSSDRGTEYTSNVMKQYMAKIGIEHQVKGGYAREQNGKAERQNRTIMEKVRTMIFARHIF